MKFIVILLCGILIWMLFGNSIKAWMQRKAIEKMEDAIRRSMGMPSRKEEQRRQQSKARHQNRDTSKHNSAARGAQHTGEPIIPKDYAVDVEFVEYKEYTQQTVIKGSGGKKTVRTETKVESQVTDVEFEEVRS